jgi:predicted signal transduction protein with EAL and GGDEF domain
MLRSGAADFKTMTGTRISTTATALHGRAGTPPETAGASTRVILALGRCLNMFVIAEGVETAGQHAFLMEHGCHAFQGYLFSRPVPIVQFEEFARRCGMVKAPDARAP